MCFYVGKAFEEAKRPSCPFEGYYHFNSIIIVDVDIIIKFLLLLLLLLHCDDCACAVVLRSVVLCFAIIISLLLLIIDGNYSDWVCTAAMSNDVMKDLRG